MKKDLFDVYESCDETIARTTGRAISTKRSTEIRYDSPHIGHKALDCIDDVSDQPFCLSLRFSALKCTISVGEQYFCREATPDVLTSTTVSPPALRENRYFVQLPRDVKEGF
jgi:hypothetical protein